MFLGEGGKPVYPGKNFSEQNSGVTNSTNKLRRVRSRTQATLMEDEYGMDFHPVRLP